MTFTTTPRGSRAARVLALPLLVAAAMGVTACGGDSAGTTTAASVTNGAAPASPDAGRGGYGGGGQAGGRFGAQTEEERAKLQACLKKEGVTLPAGRPGGPGGAGGTGTTATPPAGGDGAPPAGADGGAPGGARGGLPGAGGGRGPGGGAGMSAAEHEKLQAALKSCGAEVPDRGTRPRGGAAPDVDDATYRKSIEAYAACVRKNGFDLPKPDFSGDGPIFDPDEVDQTDATFRKASAACQSTLGSGARRSGGGSSSGGSSGTTTTAPAT